MRKRSGAWLSLSRRLLLVGSVSTLSSICAESGWSLPAGRAWAPREDIAVSDLVAPSAPMLVQDGERLRLMTAAASSSSANYSWAVVDWADSLWRLGAFTSMRAGPGWARATTFEAPPHLVWAQGDGYANLFLSKLSPDSFEPPDTAFATIDVSSEAAASVYGMRRWVVRSQHQFPVSDQLLVKVAYSDTAHVWHALEQLGINEDHCSVIGLSPTTALVTYAGQSGLGWAVADGERWIASGILDPRPFVAAHPRLSRGQDRIWLMWTERAQVHLSWFMDGTWTRGDSLVSPHAPGETYVSAWCDISQDLAERPVLAWSDLGFGSTSRDVLCVAVPTDGGYVAAEEVPQSEGAATQLSVLRDAFGDVWVAWSPSRVGGVYFVHSYCSAEARNLRATLERGQMVLKWELTESASGSIWVVLRAAGDAAFEAVAVVEAGSTPNMKWIDTNDPRGPVRYQLRRESTDARFRWESHDVRWPARSHRPVLVALSSRPHSTGAAEFAITDASAGVGHLDVIDIQGRRVSRQYFESIGEEAVTRVSVHVGMASGVYFARVTDARGLASPSSRVVILK